MLHPGEFIKKYREHFDLSGAEISSRIGFDNKYRLEKWEKKIGTPKDKDASLIKQYFGIQDLSQLTNDTLKQLFSEKVPREKITFVEKRRSHKLNSVGEDVPVYGGNTTLGNVMVYDDEGLKHQVIGRLDANIFPGAIMQKKPRGIVCTR